MKSYDYTSTENRDLILAELAELRDDVAELHDEIVKLRGIIEQLNNSFSDQSILSIRHRERLNAGRQRAKERGTKFGRTPSLTDEQKRDALSRRDNGETCDEVARALGVSRSTISRLG